MNKALERSRAEGFRIGVDRGICAADSMRYPCRTARSMSSNLPFCLRIVFFATLLLLVSEGSAWTAEESLRIQRPSSLAGSDATDSNVGTEKSSASTASFGTTGGAIPICSSESIENSLVGNYSCCDITSQYFPIRIIGPSQHFGLWLKLKLYPTLCHSVLCRRQCALNGYESCNALGVERNLIQQLNDNNSGDCSRGGSGSSGWSGRGGSCCTGSDK